jgi:hypothetical protein
LSWTALVAYAALVTFPHENVQYVVNLFCIRYTHRRVYQASAVIAIAELLLLTPVLWRAIARQPARRTIAFAWILTVALMWCIWRVFTANNTELVHFPQYLPEGMALLALTLSPADALAWVTFFGGLDECFQYWHLMAGRPVGYDFNDIYMDLAGGAAGIVLAMAFLYCEPARLTTWKQILNRRGVRLILALAAAGIPLWWSGAMRLYSNPAAHYWFALSRDKPPQYWYVNPLFGPHKFHELSPVEGPVLILATLALYAQLDRRLRISAVPARKL